MKRQFKLSIICLMLAILAAFGMFILPTSSPTVSAHRSGCHRWHSCPSDSGSYVCGDLGYTSECGTTATPKPIKSKAVTVTPRAPVVTTKTVSSDSGIPFAKQLKFTGKEYATYRRVVQPGVSGVKRTYFTVTLTDGKETARQAAKSETVTNPVTEVTVQGNRTKPTAFITQVKHTKNNGKYDVYGKYLKNKTVVLAVDSKKVKRAKTDMSGNFMFKQVKLSGKQPDLAVYVRNGSKEKKVSDTYYVELAKLKLTTQYSSLHHN